METDVLLARVCAFAAPLLPPGADVLAAVSGGSDSVAMLRLLRELRPRLGIGRLDIAHVNHGLRPGQCDREEQFVRELAESGGARFFAARLSGRSLGQPGVEAWARRERYGFFHSVRQQHGYQVVATGHTLDDQAETVLLRLERGCGLVGLAGIHARRADGVVRPVLCARREELRQYLAERGQPFCDDPSNADPRFARNRIRSQVLPEFERTEPASAERLAKIAQTVQEMLGGLYVVVNKWIAGHVVQVSDGRFVIDRNGLCGLPEAAEAVVVLLRRQGIQPSRLHIEALLRLGARGHGQHLLPGGWRAVAGPEALMLVHGDGGTDRPVHEEFRYDLAVPGTTVCGDRAVFRTEILVAGPGIDPRSRDNLLVVLDAGEGVAGLVYRNWRPGERFWPLGGKGTMTVRDFLKNQGVAAGERARTGVVATPEGEIVWIPGMRVAEGRRVGPATRSMLRVQCTRLSR